MYYPMRTPSVSRWINPPWIGLWLFVVAGCQPATPPTNSTLSEPAAASGGADSTSPVRPASWSATNSPTLATPKLRRLPPVTAEETAAAIEPEPLAAAQPGPAIALRIASRDDPLRAGAPAAAPAQPRPDVPSPPQRQGPNLTSYDANRPMTATTSMYAQMACLPRVTAAELALVKLPAAVERQARNQIGSSVSLAQRGALYAARDEFIKTLRLITQALDANLGRPLHTPALAMGLRALEEADDFAMAGRHVDADMQLEGFIAGHETPVLKRSEGSQLTPLLAIQKYYEFAYRHLALAGNRQPVAAEALFALGRCEMLMDQQPDSSGNGTPKAIAFFQAALMVDATNTRAANELGVLLAQRGRWEEAHDVLAHAARVAPTTVAFHNLQRVKQQLGRPMEVEFPNEWVAQHGNLTGPASGHPMLDRTMWVDRDTFQRLSDPATAVASTDANGDSALQPIPMPVTANEPPAPPVHVANRPGNGNWFGF